MNKEKNKIKNQRGITLIALVITIVVLVILVGVTVSTAINSGLITNSKKAVSDYDKVQTAEESHITEVEDMVAGYSSKDIMASKVAATNYGDEVSGYINLDGNDDTNDWQIFTKEGNNVWLISKDYIQLDEATAAGVGMSVDGYHAWWDVNNVPDYGAGLFNKNCVASLLDTSKWSAYVDKELALKAIGGPTVEMFAKSYNAKYPNETSGILEYEFVTTVDSEGYKFRFSTWPDDYYTNYMNGLKVDDGLYLMSDTTKANGYWIAATSLDAYWSVLEGNYMSYITGADADTPDYCVSLRPVVCLKSNVQYTSSTTGGVTTWNLVK